MQIRREDKNFYFMPRRRIDARLKKGYWFLGNEHYLAVSFWSGSDTKNKTSNISFIVVPPKSIYINKRGGCSSFIQFTARDSITKTNFLEKMTKEITGFEVFGTGEWNKKYGSINYMKNFEEFLANDKPKIDAFIGNNNIDGLSLLNADSLKYLKNIEDIKNHKIKIT